MTRTRTLFAVGFALALLLSLVPAPVAAADVTLTVTVETETGDAVNNGTVTATWNGDSVTGDISASGQVLLDVPEGQTVDLTISHETYMRNRPLVIEDATTRDVTMTVHETSEASVSVTDADGPVDDALVTFFQDGKRIVSERTTDGAIETGPIEAGTYTLRVEKSGYLDVEQSLEVTADGPVDQEVEIESGTVTLEVEVSDPYFDPPRKLAGVSVTVEGHGSVNTQSSGQQQLSVPVNTDLTVRFESPAYETVERSVETVEESVTLAVELERADTLVLTAHTTQVVVGQPAFVSVVDEYDDPVENATVLHNGEAVTETDSEGWARIPIAEAGTHEIQVDDGQITSNVTEIEAVTAAMTETPVTATPTETTTGEAGTTTDSSGGLTPGFGPIVTIVGAALALGLGLVGRRAA